MADDPRFARQRIVVDTDGAAGPKAVTAALEPAKVIDRAHHLCRHRQARPARGRRDLRLSRPQGGPGYTSHYETDAEGNYRANPISADRYTVLGVRPPRASPI